MQHSVAFATGYAASRHTFRKPLGAHQLNATRLADMLVATHATGLLLRTVTADGASAPAALVRQLLRHVAAEAMDVSRELVQLCGGHGYVEGLPPSARFQTIAWFASLLLRTDAALAQHITPGLPCPDPGALR
jgi:alkylation response protein AidB-like acyl-CoA dehydrogenase